MISDFPRYANYGRMIRTKLLPFSFPVFCAIAMGREGQFRFVCPARVGSGR